MSQFSFGRLCNLPKGEVFTMHYSHSPCAWRVIAVRDLRTQPLQKRAYRRRPELVRSTFSAKLQNVLTGRIRTVYHAETVNVRVTL